MKRAVLATMMIISAAADAGTNEVGVPNTSKIAINGANFDYVVTDGGLRTSGNISPGPVKFESIRQLALEYRDLEDVKTLPSSTRIDLLTDARSKCQELGDAELGRQSQGAQGIQGVERKFIVRGSSDLLTIFVDENNQDTFARFICRTSVTAEETAK